jgi:hypothetical protein
MNTDRDLEIFSIVAHAATGDILAVRTTGIFGFAIRCLLSRGLKRCFTNHNAPVYRKGGEMRTMQFEPPSASEWPLDGYLTKLYQGGGTAILLRPDAFLGGIVPALQHRLTFEWQNMEGMPYDKRSIRMFLRMIFRKRAHVAENDKDRMYCTEGTLLPIVNNIYRQWKPDILENERYPAPIHVEHLVRQNRLVFIAGNKRLCRCILDA